MTLDGSQHVAQVVGVWPVARLDEVETEGFAGRLQEVEKLLDLDQRGGEGDVFIAFRRWTIAARPGVIFGRAEPVGMSDALGVAPGANTKTSTSSSGSNAVRILGSTSDQARPP